MINDALDLLSARLESMERAIHLFEATLDPPALTNKPEWKGFRYNKTDVRHFCLVKASRSVSALNAAITLGREGYIQEICVLMRTIQEYTSHIHFAIQHKPIEKDWKLARNYVSAFFLDSQRGAGAEMPWAQIKQGTVHASLGAELDSIAAKLGETEARVPSAKLYANSYRVFSNYVHAKYPECMDLYGGRPGRFHLRGMLNTPKEAEVVAVIDSHYRTVEICLCTIIKTFGLDILVDTDPVAGNWFRRAIAE